jgi:hypothetical protein
MHDGEEEGGGTGSALTKTNALHLTCSAHSMAILLDVSSGFHVALPFE